jgi:uncharacterized protein
MTPTQALTGFTAALLISIATAPVGISGAVFLLPIQLSILNVPSPAVTPTNLLFNVVATPGALARYRKQHQLTGPLTRQLVTGTLPGVIVGSAIHVYLAPGQVTFRILAAAVLLPIGIWLLCRGPLKTSERANPDRHRSGSVQITLIAMAVGCVGGIYGIGGGSILAPILVGSGMAVTVVAPAALASTFITSLVGVLTYALLSIFAPGTNVAPNWALGIVCGIGGLAGGYLGARLQPRLPETALRVLLGACAVGLALLYLTQAFRMSQ